MARILIVEDHENLGTSLKSFLESNGYVVDLAKDLRSAEAKATEPFDLMVLDWNLPDGQGIDLLAKLRRNGVRTPTIFLTARAELVDKVLGLELGANDYVTKPFEPRELLARIRVQLREVRSTPASSEILTVNSLSVDRMKHRVLFRGTPIELVKKEYDLLLLFLESPGKVFSRDEILNKVWGYEVYPTTRTVDTHVMLLRQKICPDLIETVRAVGYRLNAV
jgi:DNA-binding response OmpR family regulator